MQLPSSPPRVASRPFRGIIRAVTQQTTPSTRPYPIPKSTAAVPGLVLRHLHAPDDYPQMNQIANAIRVANGDDFSTTVEQFAQFYDNLSDSDPGRDVAVAELRGRIIGYGRAAWHEEPDGPRVYEAIPFIDPAAAGEAAFTVMLEALEARLRAIAAGHPPGVRLFQTFGGDLAPERDALLHERGYEPVRHGYSMVRPSVDDLPDSPLPEGLEIRDVRPEHMAAIWAGDDEASRESWGYAPRTDSDYQRFLTDPVTSDTTLWRVAWDGDEVAGQVRSFINAEQNERLGRRRGYVEFISVRRPWRRRGLARALIAASFPLLRTRGMEEAALGVDTQNESGALRLYEACGFRRIARTTIYRKPFDGGHEA
jgi:mycothiol synthase